MLVTLLLISPLQTGLPTGLPSSAVPKFIFDFLSTSHASTLLMETAGSSEMSVQVCHTIFHHVPEDDNAHYKITMKLKCA
jgi:hypothetical protein